MSLEPSQAAISAITVLQERIKELEADKITLLKGIESLQIQIKNTNCEVSDNESNLISATERARKMIDSASIMICQIQNARNENIELKHKISQAEQYLRSFETDILAARQQELAHKKFIRKNLEEYQKILREIYSNIQQDYFGVYLSPTDVSKINYDPDLLPQPIRDVVQKMKKLPTTYSNQPIKTKRAIIQGLIRSIELANEIVSKIRALQKSLELSKTPRRIGFDIKTHAVNLYVLTKEIRRFTF